MSENNNIETKLILVVGNLHESSVVFFELLKSISEPRGFIVVDQSKKEDFNLIPQKIDFDIMENKCCKPYNQNSYKSVKERNAFFNKKKH